MLGASLLAAAGENFLKWDKEVVREEDQAVAALMKVGNLDTNLKSECVRPREREEEEKKTTGITDTKG